ncbi:alpha/beta-hydrolase [Hyaloscypha bicolor E]|uniref:Alpha/beta-hydrolase n=1 Tax=Hyaloscypha bicolor E TaxID=1095630 RepID=A0A2J6T926_9HELO|nr:alpha/beta-hydrolase [Hyaloscypha bicolor E]PMD59534.1 alpha/beta-hydrolase [Hyaloscypha bicolor E]
MDQKTFQQDLNKEKTGLLTQVIALHNPPDTHRKGRHIVTGIILAAIIWISWSYIRIHAHAIGPSCGPTETGGAFNRWGQLEFEDIIPSEKLEWHPCFEIFLCARLTVPMDYHRSLNASKDNPKVHIALTMLPGDNHTASKKYSKSPLLLNPGGPGGSGVGMVMGFGPRIHQIVGPDQDVIGFDPRGIGATTPRADCFSYPPYTPSADSISNPLATEESLVLAPDPEKEDYVRGLAHRLTWQLTGLEIGVVNSSSDSLKKLDVRARALAKLCGEKDGLYGKDSILRHIDTPSVARDMVSIIDAWDAWTDGLEDEAFDADGKSESLAARAEQVVDDQDSVSLDTKGKLVYWGFSYGTLLGATFASMFPDRVGRVILDGVIDADHYVGPVWVDSVRDADKVLASFFKYCYEAEERCALYRKDDKATDIESRFHAIMAKIKKTPITFVDHQTKAPAAISDSLVKLILFSTLYSPMGTFPFIAMVLDDFDRGTGELLSQFVYLPSRIDLRDFCAAPMPARFYPGDAQAAIMCSDKRYPLNETLSNLETVFEQMSNSSSFADIWMTLMIGCDGWKIEAVDPPMRWDDHPAHKLKPIKTSFPLLFISNSADPVTPLFAGVKMAKKFVGAGLIEQESEGHCSISTVSKCTIEKVRAYFTEGKVPSPPVEGGKGRELLDGVWDRCERDEWPWKPFDGKEYMAKRGMGAAVEAKRLRAWKEMQEAARKWKFWGGEDPVLGQGILVARLGH